MKSPSSIDDYLRDASNIFHADGAKVSKVLLPESEGELREILLKANMDNELVTVAGSHTGLTGASVPMHGGIVVGMEAMLNIPHGVEHPDQLHGSVSYLILDKRDYNKSVILPPGISLKSVESILSSHNLWFPPNPTEQLAELGSCVANNSSGARSFLYGPTRKYVNSLRVVLPQGDVLDIKRGEVFSKKGILAFESSERKYEIKVPTYTMPSVKNSAGLYAMPGMDLVDLFIGSEGILGVFSEIGIRTEYKTRIETALLFFREESQALDFLDNARNYKGYDEDAERNGFVSLEFFDSNSLKMASSGRQVKGNAAVEAEYFEIDNGTFTLLYQLAERYGALDSWVSEDISELRQSIPKNINEVVRKHGTRKVNIDTAVPESKFKKLYSDLKKTGEDYSRLCSTEGIHYAIWGHAGDCNLHLNLIPRTQEELKHAEKMYLRIISKAVQEYGGTLSAEHGVGKKGINFAGKWEPLLLFMYGDRGLREISAVKEALDPKFILNRGNMVPYGWGKA